MRNRLKKLKEYKLNHQFYDVVAIIFLIGAVLFGMTIPYEWFIFDDYLHILNNPAIEDTSLKGFLHFWTDATSKIPITFHFWQLTTAIFGMESPAPYRILNILLHCMNAVLVYYFIQKLWFLIKSDKSLSRIYYPALVGALFFLVHPVQVETVVWVSSLKGILSTFFALISLCFYLKTVEKPEGMLFYVVMMTISLSLAVLSKPSAVVIPLIFYFLDSYVMKVPFKTTLLKNTHILFFGILFSILQVVEYTSERASIDHPWFKKIILIPSSIAKYLQLVSFPTDLKFNYGYNYDWIDYLLKSDHLTLRVHLVGALIFIWLIILFSLYKKGKFKIIGFSMIFFLISISVNIGIIYYDFMKMSTVADRYLYFPIIGFSLLIAFLAEFISERFKKGYYGVSALVLALLFISTIRQNTKWGPTGSYSSSHQENGEVIRNALAEPLIGSLLNNNQYLKAFDLFVANQKSLHDEGEVFGNAFLDIFGEKKLLVRGESLILMAQINGFKLEKTSVIDFYINTFQFEKALDFLEKNKETFSRLEYKNMKKKLRVAWAKKRLGAVTIYTSLLYEYGLYDVLDKYLADERKYFEDKGFLYEAVERLDDLQQRLEYKEKIRSTIVDALNNKEKVDKVEGLLKSYHKQYKESLESN